MIFRIRFGLGSNPRSKVFCLMSDCVCLLTYYRNTNVFKSVGLPAKQNMIRNAQNTILHAKHYMSNDLAQVHEIVSRKNTCEVKMNENNEVLFSVEKGEGPYDVSLSEAVERQLQFLVDLAKSSLKVKETNTVLAVP